MSHTPEPWSIFGKDNHIMGNEYADAIRRGVDHGQWTHNCTPEDARRIVACVNACAGMPIDDLEEATKAGGLVHLAAFADQLLVERDRLAEQNATMLAALKEFTDWYDERSGDNECRPLENARSAIAKAEGK